MPLNLSTTSPPDKTLTREIQNRLLAKGYDLGKWGADGDFGDATEAAVRRYQIHEGLVADGIVGKLTYARLKGSVPTRPATSGAAWMADLAYRLVVGATDGSRPRYVFGAEVSMHDQSPDRIDCSELVQWAVTNVDGGRTWVDGSRYQYEASRHISVERALRTKGALLFQTGNRMPSGIHHVAISMGNLTTAEARSAHMTPQCGTWPAADRFQFGALIPVLTYT